MYFYCVQADADNSGKIEPKELVSILRSLGWRIKLKAATILAEKMEAEMDELGHLTITEAQFVDSIQSGQLGRELEKMNIPSSSDKLKDSDKLVEWILKSKQISDSLSGATQLMLLAHTPVSTKVFLYFHCHYIAGRSLLRADYDISCQSDEYYQFVVFVLIVLIGFTIALPGVISFYLWVHNDELYSTKVHGRIGWLCK